MVGIGSWAADAVTPGIISDNSPGYSVPLFLPEPFSLKPTRVMAMFVVAALPYGEATKDDDSAAICCFRVEDCSGERD